MFLLGGTLLALVAVLVLAILMKRAEEEFVELRDPNQIRQILEKQGSLKTEVSISEFQRERLYDTVVQLLFLYRDGDWEKFWGYLQERRGAFNSERLKGIREMFANPKHFDESGRKILTKIANHFRKWPPQGDDQPNWVKFRRVAGRPFIPHCRSLRGTMFAPTAYRATFAALSASIGSPSVG